MQWSDLPRNPARKTLQQFGALGVVFFGVVAWRCYSPNEPSLTVVLGVLAGAFGLAALAYPKALRVVFVGWLMAVFPIGFLVSRLVLAVLFYGCFTPIAMVFRIIGRDALGLKRAPAAETYWRARPATADPARYLQPF